VTLLVLLGAACSHSPSLTSPIVVRGASPDPFDDDRSIAVAADRVWTDTHIDVAAGQSLTVSADGAIVACRPGRYDEDVASHTGPEGTFLFSDKVLDRDFPLPAGGLGPAPCYCLIGRIGEGAPFFVGRSRNFTAEHGGRLFLGINDFDVSDNAGEFVAAVEFDAGARPIAYERVYARPGTQGRPARDCSVVVFYVDGLRPDVVREMVALGHLPNIRRHFLEGGAWLANTVTAFPSDTITSNGTMWTGSFSDQHGLKGQVEFNRRRLTSHSYLSDPLGPYRSAQALAPQGADKMIRQTQAAAVGMIFGDAARATWLDSLGSSVAPLYVHLQQHRLNWAVGVMPVMTEVPPPLWTRSMSRHLPYLQAQRGWEYMDDANTDYTIKNLLQRREAVTVVWLPETDSYSHKCSRGQFGTARRAIAHADRLMGTIVDELRAQGRLDSTYLMLVSDHGHIGGRDTQLSHFDLASDFFFRPRTTTADGNWTGGGLGLSVRMHRFQNRHPGDSSREFVFVDGDSSGAARIYLPREHYRSKDWSGPSRACDLLRYRLDAGREPLDLPASLAHIRAVHGSGEIDLPVDLVLMKLTDESVLVTTADRGQAVIERRATGPARWEYRYSVVSHVAPRSDGAVEYQVLPRPHVDPLGLASHLPPHVFGGFHDERLWLDMTAHTEYPDAVVALTRHMLWQEGIRSRENECAPDLVVTARAGWYFGTEASPGTMHGYPLAEAARATWFVSGPGVRRGARIETPCRLTDLTPTILDMVGLWGDDGLKEWPHFDGRPLRELYAASLEYVAAKQPVYWQDVDLGAWQALTYVPLSSSDLKPMSINSPNRAFDLSNIAYGVTTLGDLTVFRLADDIMSPVAGDRRYVQGAVERTEAFFRRRPQELVSQGSRVPDVSGISLTDYSVTSQGNLQRMDRAVDWMQGVGEKLDDRLASPFQRESLPWTGPFNQGIDATQEGFWELYRFGQRTIIRTLDEQVLNRVEDGVDRTLNVWRRVPSEVIIERDDASAAKW
jgi:hypothetical protein